MLSLVVVVFFGGLQLIKTIPNGFQDVLGFASNITPNEVIDRTNEERVKQGLGTVTFNENLSQAALAKAQDMINDQYWAHVAPDGKEPWAFMKEANYEYQVAGENLARDFGTTPDMMAAWMASPTHRANIVNPKYTEIGIAVVDGVFQGYETTLVVQMFGKPKSIAQLGRNGEIGTANSFDDAQLGEVSQPSFSFSEAAPQATQQRPGVLAGIIVPGGEVQVPPLFAPLQLVKAFFLSIIFILVGTLIYDAVIIEHRQTARIVGKNAAHIIFFAAVTFLLLFFKGGIIG
jgi:hypothetical protein